MSGRSAKRYVPLESNPEVFTELIRKLGVSGLTFHDIYSVDDPELLSFVPRPVLALVLVFPTTKAYETQIAAEESKREPYVAYGDDEDVVWFKQTIGNACGLYGVLHAVCNGEAKKYIEPNSTLSKLLEQCISLAPAERARALEESAELEAAHASSAQKGISAAPPAEAHVDYHYTCFAKSHRNGRLYELNGDLKGPVDRGPAEGDLLSESALTVIREFLHRDMADNIGFSLMALSK